MSGSIKNCSEDLGRFVYMLLGRLALNCRCHKDYKRMDREDPTCQVHDIERELDEVLEKYEKGEYD